MSDEQQEGVAEAAAKLAEQLPEAPQGIQPQPLPEQWTVDAIRTPTGDTGCVVQIRALNGVHVSFLTHDFALQLADLIQRTVGGSGIVVATPGQLAQLEAAKPKL